MHDNLKASFLGRSSSVPHLKVTHGRGTKSLVHLQPCFARGCRAAAAQPISANRIARSLVPLPQTLAVSVKGEYKLGFVEITPLFIYQERRSDQFNSISREKESGSAWWNRGRDAETVSNHLPCSRRISNSIFSRANRATAV